MFQRIRKPKVKCDPRHGKYMACCMMYRGASAKKWSPFWDSKDLIWVWWAEMMRYLLYNVIYIYIIPIINNYIYIYWDICLVFLKPLSFRVLRTCRVWHDGNWYSQAMWCRRTWMQQLPRSRPSAPFNSWIGAPLASSAASTISHLLCWGLIIQYSIFSICSLVSLGFSRENTMNSSYTSDIYWMITIYPLGVRFVIFCLEPSRPSWRGVSITGEITVG